MKTFTNCIKNLVLTCILGLSGLSMAQPCSTNFTAMPGVNGTVAFTATGTVMTPTVSYYWSFGAPGGYTTVVGSNLASYTYTANGVYTVTLVYLNSAFSCSATATQTVLINNICSLNANFTSSLGLNGLVNFINTSTGTIVGTTYSWDFGDGGTSTSTSPSHTYASGTYSVWLKALNGLSPYCVDSTMIPVTVTNTCVANAGFSLSPTGTPQYWNAFPQAPANIANATWSWGDGSTSNTLYTSHTYSAAGTYSICLSVTVTCGATATSCYTYAIYRSSQDMSIVHVNVVNPATVGIESIQANVVGFNVYPNPNNGSFNLNLDGLSSDKVNIGIYNMVGKLVYQFEGTNSNGTLTKDIQLNDTSSGVYFIKVAAADQIITKKIIITK